MDSGPTLLGASAVSLTIPANAASESDSILDPRLDVDYLGSFNDKLSVNSPSQLLDGPSIWDQPSLEDSPITFGDELPDASSWPVILTEDAADTTTTPSSTHPSSGRASAISSPRVSRTSSKSSVPSLEAIRSAKKPQAKKPRPQRNPKQKQPKLIKQEPEDALLSHEEDSGVPGSNRRNKFLERNRQAASKCRQKKKEWIQDLEQAKGELETQHMALQREYSELMAEASWMKNRLMVHAGCNDPKIDLWIETQAKKFVNDSVDPQRRPSAASLLSLCQSPPGSIGLSPVDFSADRLPSPDLQTEPINYDHMPDDMFDD